MAIENAIAQFGQRTRSGGDGFGLGMQMLARRDANQQYEERKNMLLAEREREVAAQQEQAERMHLEGGVKAMMSAPPEQRGRVYQGWVQDAQRRGFDLDGVPNEYSDDVLYTLAGAAGVDLSRPRNDLPSDVQSYEYYSQLPDDQRNEFLNVKRAGQALNLGDRTIYRDPSGGEQVYQRGVPQEKTPEYRADVKEAEEGAKATAKAKADLPQDIANAEEMLSLLDTALNHPGLEAATGFSSVLNPVAAPGTKRRDFLVLLDQLKGKTFLQAFQSLKGAGQITEVEGRKATDAIARLNTAQSEDEFKSALTDLKDVVSKGATRAKSKAGSAEAKDVVDWGDL